MVVSYAVLHFHRRTISPYLVEVLQQVQNPALDLILRQTGAGGVASYGLEVCGGSDLLGLNEGARRAGH